MFAVIKTGGKQYRVVENEVLLVEKLAGAAGESVRLGEVLMLGGEGSPSVGLPRVDKAAVFAEVIEQTRSDKIIVFKKKRRQGYRRKHGHRQQLTVLRILEISPNGTQTKTVAAKPAAKPKAEAGAAQPQKKAKAAPKGEARPKAAAKPKAKAKGKSKE